LIGFGLLFRKLSEKHKILTLYYSLFITMPREFNRCCAYTHHLSGFPAIYDNFSITCVFNLVLYPHIIKKVILRTGKLFKYFFSNNTFLKKNNKNLIQDFLLIKCELQKS